MYLNKVKIKDLLKWKRGGILSVNPEYQRGAVWKEPQQKKSDSTRLYGEVEREILYYQYKRKCVVCDSEIDWNDLEIHHVKEHQYGGETTLENGVPAHKMCQPKGAEALSFDEKWQQKLQNKLSETDVTETQKRLKAASPSASEWTKSIPELQGYNNIGSWADICNALQIEINGDSVTFV